VYSADEANVRYQLSDALDHPASHPVIADCDYGAITNIRGAKRRQVVITSEYFVSQHVRSGGFVRIEQSDDAGTVLLKDVDNNSRMP
jgi:hypothetical protein